jgi:hypothetical protein
MRYREQTGTVIVAQHWRFGKPVTHPPARRSRVHGHVDLVPREGEFDGSRSERATSSRKAVRHLFFVFIGCRFGTDRRAVHFDADGGNDSIRLL